MNGSAKVYVDVNVDFSGDGGMLPRALVWEDGRVYRIQKVTDLRPAHAERAGGSGDRYTILVDGRERYLFFEHSTEFGDPGIGRWFLERKE